MRRKTDDCTVLRTGGSAAVRRPLPHCPALSHCSVSLLLCTSPTAPCSPNAQTMRGKCMRCMAGCYHAATVATALRRTPLCVCFCHSPCVPSLCATPHRSLLTLCDANTSCVPQQLAIQPSTLTHWPLCRSRLQQCRPSRQLIAEQCVRYSSPASSAPPTVPTDPAEQLARNGNAFLPRQPVHSSLCCRLPSAPLRLWRMMGTVPLRTPSRPSACVGYTPGGLAGAIRSSTESILWLTDGGSLLRL